MGPVTNLPALSRHLMGSSMSGHFTKAVTSQTELQAERLAGSREAISGLENGKQEVPSISLTSTFYTDVSDTIYKSMLK